MAWLATLSLDYAQREGPNGRPRTVVHARHLGPLRVMQSLYPEAGGICHTVLVHPPSGLTGGDTLDIQVALQPGAHAVLTTPGATRFYRTLGEPATQSVSVTLSPGSRLEWLPLENIAYNACRARNLARFELAGDASLMAWDVTALGLPASGLPFTHGSFLQRLEVAGCWIDAGQIDAGDRALMDGPLGLSGQRCLATLFVASGEAMGRGLRDNLLELARERIGAHELLTSAAATAPNPRVVVLRALAPQVEPAMRLLRQVRGAWRQALWQLPTTAPRVWMDEQAS